MIGAQSMSENVEAKGLHKKSNKILVLKVLLGINLLISFYNPLFVQHGQFTYYQGVWTFVSAITLFVTIIWYGSALSHEQYENDITQFKQATGKTIPECKFRVKSSRALQNRMGSNLTVRMELEEEQSHAIVFFDFKLGDKKYITGMQAQAGDSFEITPSDMNSFLSVQI